jgi:hypothetical protein
MFGKVALTVLLIRRRCSSAWLRGSVAAGLAVLRPLMYVAVSRAIGVTFVSVGGYCLQEPDNNNNKPRV